MMRSKVLSLSKASMKYCEESFVSLNRGWLTVDHASGCGDQKRIIKRQRGHAGSGRLAVIGMIIKAWHVGKN